MNSEHLDSHAIGALVALVNQGRLHEAEQRALKLLTKHPANGMLWKTLSVALMRQGKDALQALRRTAELLPQDAEAHGNLGTALLDRGQWADAFANLQRALAIQPHAVDLLVDAANALKELGRAPEAVPLYQRALQRNPHRVDAHNNMGNAFLTLGQYEQAADCYRRAFEIKPDDAQILCNLGNALRQHGLLDQAVMATRSAITLDPRLSVAHNNLGLILAALGQREQAVASYQQALVLNPNYVEALSNLGNVLRDLGARREALALYARALELEPGRAENHCNLGNALVELRRIDDAATCFRQSLALQPDYAKAHLCLATILRVQQHTAAAEASCQAALAIDPNYVEALSLLGELRADRGLFVEAEGLFQRAITINPEFAFGFLCLATHRKMTRDNTAWRDGAEALLGKRLSLAQSISLHYALGKYYDDVQHYDNAFGHYRQANELTKRYGTTYNGAKLTEQVDHMIHSFDSEFMRHGESRGSTAELPVFIIGMPRSGTSLTEQILASHSAVFGAGELSFWDSAFPAYRKAQSAGQDASLIPDMANDYLHLVTALSGEAQRVIDKMPPNFFYAGLIHAVFPRARIIHLQRHPIDTCLSIYFQNFFKMGPYANDLSDLAHYYGEYRRLTAHWRAVLPATTLLEIPYESLVEDQEGWTRRMLDFIGLPWDSRCLDFHQTDRTVLTASKWQVRQKINSTSIGRRKNYEKFLGPLQCLMNPSASSCVREEAAL